MTNTDKDWERIHAQLLYQLHGDERPRVASTRTLFGIRSTVEEKMDRFAAEIEAERKQRVRKQR